MLTRLCDSTGRIGTARFPRFEVAIIAQNRKGDISFPNTLKLPVLPLGETTCLS